MKNMKKIASRIFTLLVAAVIVLSFSSLNYHIAYSYSGCNMAPFNYKHPDKEDGDN
ncbi:MAG: hypothetical protein FWE21_02760 [Defluviitaleaceae bacterium]|nr:hypothetical protein [Defluviitaleaceae bacterium]